VLVSHSHGFIYFKTKKTASTSTEIFFEPYCVADPLHRVEHSTRQLVSNAGIVGSRRNGILEGDSFYNHMPAVALREFIGQRKFNSYLKICNVRNPFDKMVSRFWWILSKRGTVGDYMHLSFDDIRKRFNLYIAQSGAGLLDNDRSSYFIDGNSAADRYIRFEHLSEDIESTCSSLDIPYKSSSVGWYNNVIRHTNEPISAFYDDASKEKVERIFSWDIRMFGYKL